MHGGRSIRVPECGDPSPALRPSYEEHLNPKRAPEHEASDAPTAILQSICNPRCRAFPWKQVLEG